MKILDRYIFRNFFQQLILWYITLIGLFIVLDVFQRYESFFSNAGDRNPFALMGLHYFFISFSVIDMLLPLLIVMSALGSMATMLRRNEVIALQALGVSKLRIITPILIGAVILSLFSLYIREIFVPGHKIEMVKSISELATPESGLSVKRTGDNYTKIEIAGYKIHPEDKRIEKPVIIFPPINFGLELGKIEGETALFSPATSEHPQGYLVQKVFKGEDILKKNSLVLKEIEKPIILTPVDYPKWLKEDECFVVSGIAPERLMVGQQWFSFASIKDLLREIRNPSCDYNRRDIAIKIHTRILRPFLDLIPILIALPFILLRCDRHVVKAMSIGGFLALVFIGVQFLCAFFGPKFDMPVLAAWFPLLLFAPLVTNVFRDLQR